MKIVCTKRTPVTSYELSIEQREGTTEVYVIETTFGHDGNIAMQALGIFELADLVKMLETLHFWQRPMGE